jgi:glutathione synthase
MRILILTDHLSHSMSNSFYGIAASLSRHPDVRAVWAASRSDPRNRRFFFGKAKKQLWTVNTEGLHDMSDFSRAMQEPAELFALDSFDGILLRLPRPIRKDFFPALSAAYPEKFIFNRPSGIELTSNKSFLLKFQDLCPPMKLCHNWEDIEDFARQFPIVLKPLESYGAQGLVRIDGDQVWLEIKKMKLERFRTWYEKHQTKYLAMRFLRNVRLGDKRIVVANGKVIACSLRKPPPDSWLCNVSQGGTSEPSQPEPSEERILERLGPSMRRHGIFLYGVDTLARDRKGRALSEVNTLSPGGIVPSERESGNRATQLLADEFVKVLKEAHDIKTH